LGSDYGFSQAVKRLIVAINDWGEWALQDIERTFRELAPAVDFCSLRLVRERHELLTVRRNIVQPVRRSEDDGAMITIHDGGGLGYAATSDLSPAGLGQAIKQAHDWAKATAGHHVVALTALDQEVRVGEYAQPARRPWSDIPLPDKLAVLQRECERLKIADAIVEWQAGFWHSDLETLYLTGDGSRIQQRFHTLLPSLSATAHRQGETQIRSFGGAAHLRQGGLEILEETGFYDAAPSVAEQALNLLDAPNCPTDMLDIVLAPDQMVLQIHESIGHPLELDRILGDERNYAGTSFVTPEMFGRYQYGSELLNITFDPDHAEQIASYGYDDEGQPAQREYLIEQGILLRPLGGAISQARAGLPGVANARASSWNRPPIDRMANLNLEPGESRFNDLIGAVEHGVYMETNRSWSIDDSRNKFQFGCEWGRLIENGALGPVVKNPNYRGISAQFWRNLHGVGNAESFQVMGVPYCGKGEPNQVIRVGHAAPPCLFRDVAVFGGE
jgi:predicted Zn-dependent protease